MPPSLTRGRRAIAFVAYRIEALLQAGPNEIRIGVYRDRPSVYDRSWTPLLAFDGAIINAGRPGQCFGSDAFTECGVSDGIQGSSHWTRAVSDGPIRPELLPSLTYMGWAAWPQSPGIPAGLGFALFAAVFATFNYHVPR